MPTSDEREILAAEARWIERYALNDADAFEHILADDFLYVSPAGCEVVRRRQYIDNLRDGTTKMTRFDQTEVLVRVYADVALVTARAAVEENLRGQQWSGSFYMIRVWRRIDAQAWRAVAFHLTDCSAH